MFQVIFRSSTVSKGETEKRERERERERERGYREISNVKSKTREAKGPGRECQCSGKENVSVEDF